MTQFASGKRALAECDICAHTVKLTSLKEQVVKGRPSGVMACRACWSPDHPQLYVGMSPVQDPQALRRPRPDRGLGPYGSRDVHWGWAPVGGGTDPTSPLLSRSSIGTVEVVLT